MTLELRELKGSDLFTLLTIVGKLDVKGEFVKMFEKNIETTEVVTLDHQQKKPTKAELKKMEEAQRKQDLEAQRRGMEMMAAIVQKTLSNIKSVKTDINLFLAELTGSDVSTIENLGIKEYTTLIVTFFQKPELADFFSSIATLL